jgi:signal recognition particle subunit SRP54
MFSTLSDSLGNAFSKLRGKGLISEEDVNNAMREVRIALLEADVALPVVKEFIAAVKEKAIGEAVVKSIAPAQMVIKIVQDELTRVLGGEGQELNLRANPPVVILMCGLQGSGKTTTTGKLALWLKQKQKKKSLLASLDIYRPAAQEQLATLGRQLQVDTLRGR